MWFINPFCDTKKIMFFEGEHNAILTYDIDTEKTAFISSVPNESFNGFMRYNVSIKNNDSILVVPQYGDALFLYSIQYDKWEKIYDVKEDLIGEGKYVSAIKMDNYAVLIPWHQKRVIIYNFDNKEINYIDGWYEEVVAEDDERDVFAGNVFCHEGIAYIPFCEYPSVLAIDVKKMIFQLIHLDVIEGRISGNSGIVIINDTIYLAPRHEKCLYSYDMDGNILDVYDVTIENYKMQGKNEKVFSDAIYQNGKIWLFPDQSNMIISFDVYNNKFEPIFVNNLTNQDYEIDSCDSFTAYKPFVLDKNHIGFIVPGKELIFVIDTEKRVTSSYIFKSKLDSGEYKKIVYKNEILHEDDFSSLKLFLKTI